MSRLSIDIKAEILKALEKVGDDGMTIASIAYTLKLREACLRPVLSELGGNMAIRSTQGFRNVRYWIPSEAQLKAEEEARNIRPFRPLKLDRAKLEIYAEIDAARLAIPSIG